VSVKNGCCCIRAL